MADMSVALKQQSGDKHPQSISATIDTVNECPAPLDFSFFKLTTVEEAEKEEPRVPKLGRLVSPRDTGKFSGRCLRMNNNQISEIKSIDVFINKTFTHPDCIGWIDLSFNALTAIDCILLEFHCLEILYLHGNNISNLSEVNKLASLPNLRKLTLHGNPVESQPGYRLCMIATLRSLRNLDFSGVTKCERKTADCCKRFGNTNKKKKKTEDDD